MEKNQQNPSDNDTPLLDELEDGRWPSFVKELKSAANRSPMAKDLLGQLELSYREKVHFWKHGGIVGIRGYGAGVIGRYSDAGDKFPNVSECHTLRVGAPAGKFYTSEVLRKLCDVWERHGSGLANFHGSTGDIIFLGCKKEYLEEVFQEFIRIGFDLGGSGSVMRTPNCCIGPARCEWACYDTLGLTHEMTMAYLDELHRPFFPHKFKIKCSGCPNDCAGAIARSDIAIIGIWKDDIQIDQQEVRKYADSGLNIQEEVVGRCPARCMDWNGSSLYIDDSSCVKCMHCINVMTKALKPGKERGASILVGGKVPITEGPRLASVLVPFWQPSPSYSDLKDLIDRILEVWGDEGRNRERVGEFIQRIGLANFIRKIGIDPVPEMIDHPRENPYMRYEKAERIEGESL